MSWGCKIRSIGQVLGDFKFKFLDGSHHHCGLGRCDGEEEHSSPHQLVTPNLLDFLLWLSQKISTVGPCDGLTFLKAVHRHRSGGHDPDLDWVLH